MNQLPPEQMTPEAWTADPRSTHVPRGSILAIDGVSLAQDLFAEDLLAKYSNDELAALAMVIGASSKSGTKAARCRHIVATLRLRIRLADETPESLVARYRLAELKRLSHLAKLYMAPTKYTLAVGLINWRTRARYEGRKALAEGIQLQAAMRAIEQGRPINASLAKQLLKPRRGGRYLTDEMMAGYVEIGDLFVRATGGAE